jgi:glycoprotein 3-alpha-L-fucosyltransferase
LFHRKLQVDAVIATNDGYYGTDSFPEPKLPPGIHQITYLIESPCHTGSARLGINNAWIAGYSRSSDIPISYGNFIKINETLQSSPKPNRKQVVALISNCFMVKNNRMGYITELKKYIGVDVYGKCGDLKCPDQNCLDYLRSNYKFYLAFENCNCDDYITEKFYANSQGMISIVMGAPRENYESFNLPKKSFIHVDDFSSPEELAKYLLFLDKDDEAYGQYFRWGSDQVGVEFLEDFFCRTCALLYYSDFIKPNPWPSTSTRWGDINECLANGQWNYKMKVV